MRKTMLSMFSAFALAAAAGSASAGQLLTEDQLDTVTASGNISVDLSSAAQATWNITSNDDHDVTVTSSNVAINDVTIEVDAATSGTSAAQSTLTASVVNN